ncbi:MAG: hypothetical protein HQ515_13510 [Phycisphaeraceae bacterium]|nr:hypothetical protein [Phycisphaeraceae bacterium]
MKARAYNRNRLGMSRIKVAAILVVLPSLGYVLYPNITASAISAKINACAASVDQINKQIEIYHVEKGAWPDELGLVVEDPDYFRGGPPVCPFSHEGYVYNTAKKRVEAHSH